jgi:uncharacterized membrane protein YsdA (DUF1294 family)
MRRRPVGLFALLTFGLTIAGTFLLWQFSRSLGLLWAWLIVINLITFLAFGYDKAIAGSQRMRVPEIVLLALTFFGGTVGALLGRIVFRHKTVKASFRVKFWVVLVIQIALLVVYVLYFELQVLGA